jgi:hypothetical protein
MNPPYGNNRNIIFDIFFLSESSDMTEKKVSIIIRLTIDIKYRDEFLASLLLILD